MKNKSIAIKVVKEFLSKKKRIFKIPKYGFFLILPYFLIVFCKKVKYGKLFLNDYEDIGRFLKSKAYKKIEEPIAIIEIEEFDTVFIFHLGTRMELDDKHRYGHTIEDLERPIFFDRKNGDLYRLLPNIPSAEWYVDLFKYKDLKEEEYKNNFKKLPS